VTARSERRVVRFRGSLDEGDEPFEDESCWIKANPNLGVSIHSQYIREQVQEAKGMPSKEGLVRRLNFCQWTESEKQRIPRANLGSLRRRSRSRCADEAGYRCFGGLDLSRTRQRLTAFTLTWLLDETKDQWRSRKTWFWTPKDTLRNAPSAIMRPMTSGPSRVHIEAVPGKRIKYRGWPMR
jgi:phage terminase large subunit-like protein